MSSGGLTFKYENNEAFEELADGDSPIFDSRVRFLVFAASVGYAKDRSVEDPGEDNYIRWNYIGQDSQLSVITASLAYSVTEDPEVILDPHDQFDVLSRYGAGGARLIKKEVVDAPGDNLDNLVDFIQNHRNEDEMKERVGVLEEIEREISSLKPSAE